MASTKSNYQPKGTSPKDDWSNISDPASRKRAQNRIAQRNYRKNLKSRIEKLERQAALMSTHHLLPTDGMPSISDYDYMPSGPDLPGLATRCNGFASYSASPTEGRTFRVSDLGVDSKISETSSSLSTLPLLGNVYAIENEPGSGFLTSDLCNDIDQCDYISPATPQSTPPQQSPNMIVSHPPGACTCRGFSGDGSLNESETPHGCHDNLSLAEKIQAVLSAIHDAGFDGLESFVSLYYTSDLTSFPSLANARRLSRNRGLPGILVDVRQNMPLWTEWEKQRYKDEVLRSAEAILQTECTGLNSNGRLRDLVSNVTQSKEKKPSSLLAEMGTDLQNELPNLWALTTSLTTDPGATAKMGTCDLSTTLSVMYMLSCSGIASGEDIRKMAVRCLQA